MKEQNAAHSFGEKENDVLDKFIEVVEDRHFLEEFAPGGYWKVKEGMKEECNAISEVKEFISDCVAELTRLRSELQQKDEVIQELVEVLSFYYHRSEREVNRLRSLIEKSKAK